MNFKSISKIFVSVLICSIFFSCANDSSTDSTNTTTNSTNTSNTNNTNPETNNTASDDSIGKLLAGNMYCVKQDKTIYKSNSSKFSNYDLQEKTKTNGILTVTQSKDGVIKNTYVISQTTANTFSLKINDSDAVEVSNPYNSDPTTENEALVRSLWIEDDIAFKFNNDFTCLVYNSSMKWKINKDNTVSITGNNNSSNSITISSTDNYNTFQYNTEEQDKSNSITFTKVSGNDFLPVASVATDGISITCKIPKNCGIVQFYRSDASKGSRNWFTNSNVGSGLYCAKDYFVEKDVTYQYWVTYLKSDWSYISESEKVTATAIQKGYDDISLTNIPSAEYDSTNKFLHYTTAPEINYTTSPVTGFPAIWKGTTYTCTVDNEYNNICGCETGDNYFWGWANTHSSHSLKFKQFEFRFTTTPSDNKYYIFLVGQNCTMPQIPPRN